MKQKFLFLGVLTLGLLSLRLNGLAQNICIDNPVNGGWSCTTGHVNYPGTLSKTNDTICVGNSSTSILSGVTFVSGQKTLSIYHTCPEYPPVETFHYNVNYNATNWWEPAIPAIFTNTGVFSFTNKVKGLSADATCPNPTTTVTSGVFIVTVSARPSIITQPTNQTVYAGNSAVFTVAASGVALTYQWRFNDTNNIGVNSPTLTLNNVQTANAGNYSVIITTSAGCSTNSITAVLNVQVPPYTVLCGGSLTNYTFKGDTTYYICGNVYSYGTNTFEGGAVFKYATNGAIYINPGPPGTGNPKIIWLGDDYRPVIFTAKDDNSVGETIVDSTGSPTGPYYANPALNIAYPNAVTTLKSFRITYSKQALSLTASGIYHVQDGQIINCQFGISSYGVSPRLGNLLFANVRTNFNLPGGSGMVAENVTFNGSGYLVTRADAGPNLSFTNCIFANVTNLSSGTVTVVGSHNGFHNSFSNSTFGSAPTSAAPYPFQAIGAGAHYLTNNTFRNIGTTNIDVELQASLKRKTTYSPVLRSNVTALTPTVLTRQVQRDIDLPDLGYHYQPIDYLAYDWTITNTSLIITGGVAIGYFNHNGLVISGGTTVHSEGTPTAMNKFVHYQTVQEQPLRVGTYAAGSGFPVNSWRGTGTPALGFFRFTEFQHSLAGVTPPYFFYTQNPWEYSDLTVRDCFFGRGIIDIPANDGGTFAFENNVFENQPYGYSGGVWFYDWVGYDFTLTLRNNLFYGGNIYLDNYGANAWTLKDNAFDSVDLADWGNPQSARSHNAYIKTAQLIPAGAGDIVISNFIWTAGPLGNHYQHSTNLLNRGSQTATAAGLYHYTTTTNQVKETNSIVDIGFHYVAVNSNGYPVDDISGPISVTVCPGSAATFSVSASGVSPFSYVWRRDGILLSGQTNSTLTITNVSQAEAGNYTVQIIGAGGLVTNSATLSVMTNLVAHGPYNAAYVEGDSKTLIVDAIGSGPIHYVWKHDGLAVGGGTNRSFAITNFTTMAAGDYVVEISGACGSQTNSATLSIAKIITYGESATLSAGTLGFSSPTYQWKHNGINIPGATGGSYTETKPPVSASGDVYEVIVSKAGYPSKTRRFVLTVTPAVLTLTADNKERYYGDANPTLTYQIAGFVNGENQSVLTGQPVIGSAAHSGSSVSGSPYPIVVAKGTLSAANYSFNFVNGLLAVTKANLSVYADKKTKLFGDINPPLTGAIIGIQNHDPITATYSTSVNQSTAAGTYVDSITPTLVDPAGRLANYNVTVDNTGEKGDFTINVPALTINLPAGGNLAYMLGRPPTPLDGNASVTGTFGDGYFVGKQFSAAFKMSQPKDSLCIRNYRRIGNVTFSDNFNRSNGDSLGSSWVEAAGDVDISANTAVPTASSLALNLAIYSGSPTVTPFQFAKVTLPTAANNNNYAYLVFRYSDSASPFYAISFRRTSSQVAWHKFSNSADNAGTTIGSPATLSIAQGNSFGVTLDGTGDNTIVRIWKNPSGSSPTSVTNWGGDTTPDVTFTTNPGTNAVDSGNFVGIAGRQQTASSLAFDSFSGGDIPGSVETIRSSDNGDGSRNITYNDSIIGTSEGGTAENPLVVTFNSTPSQVSLGKHTVELVLQNVCFFNTAISPSEAERQIEMYFTDPDDDDARISPVQTVSGSANCPGPNAIDVILVIDKTQSMVNNSDVPGSSGITRLQAAKNAAKDFIDYLSFNASGPSDKAKIISFCSESGSNPTHETGFLTDGNALKTAIDGIGDCSWTVYHPSLIASRSALNAIKDEQRLQIIIFLSDGKISSATSGNVPIYTQQAKDEADLIRQDGFRLFTIGIGNEVTAPVGGEVARNLLTYMSSSQSADDFWMPSEQLPLSVLYARIVNSVCRETNIKHPPILNWVNTLNAAEENKRFPISYEYLLVNSDASDPDGNPDTQGNFIQFRIISVENGVLKKNGVTVSEGDGGTLIGPGENLTWTPASLSGALTPSGQIITAFKIRAWDGALHSETAFPIPVPITVTLANKSPIVNAGPDLSVPPSVPITLEAEPVTDIDNRFTSPPLLQWTRISGPGEMSFATKTPPETGSYEPSDLNPKVFFEIPGHYVLRLTANDGQYTASDEISVNVCGVRELPLDVFFVIDDSGSMSEVLVSAKQAIKNLLEQLRFNDGESSDAVGVAAFRTCGATPLLTAPEAINEFLETLDATGGSDLSQAFAWATARTKEYMSGRAARPVIVVVSDFNISYDPADVAAAKASGVRIVAASTSDFYWLLAQEMASPGHAYKVVDHATELSKVLDTIRQVDCFAKEDAFSVFAYGPKSAAISAGTASFTLDGQIIDARVPFEGIVDIQHEWKLVNTTGEPEDVNFDSSLLEPVVTINPAFVGNTYTFRFVGTLNGSEPRNNEITVTLVSSVENEPPMAHCDVRSVKEDSVANLLDVLRNDFDHDGDDLYIAAVSVPAGFRGVVEISPDAKTLEYTPDPNFNTRRFVSLETDNYYELVESYEKTFSYTVRDRTGAGEGLTATADVRLRVVPVDDPPIATPDRFDVDRGTFAAQPLDVLANDINVDDDEIDQSDPLNKQFTFVDVSSLPPNSGTITIDNDNLRLLYTVDPSSAEGQEVSFTYTIQDVHGNTAAALVTVRITDNPINLFAVADNVQAWIGTTPIIRVLDNDNYPVGSTPNISSLVSVSAPVSPFVISDYFSNLGDRLQFFPKKLDETGTAVPGTYIVNYTMSLPPAFSTAQLKIHLGPPGPAPVAHDDSGFFVEQNVSTLTHSVTVPVLVNDTGTGLLITDITVPPGAYGTAVQGTGADLGKIIYTPDIGFYGEDSFSYTIVDIGGRTSTATARIVVYPANDTSPVGILTNVGDDPNDFPIENIEPVNDGIFVARGTANDADANDAFHYELNAYSVDPEFYPLEKVATYQGNTRIPGTDAVLGNLDLRSVPDGVYEVELVVYGGRKTASVIGLINLQSSYKIGNLKFSETDLTVNLAGVPISVIRSYDSIKGGAGKGGDYGPGWTFDLNDMQVEINETREMVQDDESVWFSRRSGGGLDVSLTLPNGRRVTFPFRLDPSLIDQSLNHLAVWDSPLGVAAQLFPEREERVVTLPALPGSDPLPPYWSRNFQTSMEKYDISGFRLSMPDGTIYHIGREPDPVVYHFYEDGVSGADIYVEPYGKPQVTQVDLPTGDHYYFSKEGVDHQLPGQSERVPAFRIERNAAGLIKAVHDRHTLDAAGQPIPNGNPAVVYEYENGHLVRVNRLRERGDISDTNPKYDTTSYEYNNPHREHLVTDIFDARHVRVAKTTYDERGRMEKIEQPDGRWMQYHHDDLPSDGAVARERIVDSEGNTTVHDTDARGNVLLTIDAIGTETARTFDENDNARTQVLRDSLQNTISQSENVLDYSSTYPSVVKRRLSIQGGVNGSAVVKTFQEFDDVGRLLRVVDAKNATEIPDAFDSPNVDFANTFEYDTAGRILTATVVKAGSADVVLSHTTYYDTAPFTGMIHESEGTLGEKTVYDYYSGTTYDAIQTDKVIGRFGDIRTLTTVDSNGNAVSQVEYQYNESGNRIKEIRKKNIGTPATPNWVIYSATESKFDARGRVYETIDAAEGHSYTHYDSTGRTESTVDRYGAETKFIYNAVGDLVQTEFPDHSIARSAVFYVEVGDSARKLKRTIVEERHPSTAPVEQIYGTLTGHDELGRVVFTDRVRNLKIDLVDDGPVKKTVYRSSIRVNDGVAGTADHDSQTKYDAAGWAYMSADAAGKWTKYDYDDKGRRWRTKSFVAASGADTANTLVTISGYDENGNQAWTLDANQYEVIQASQTPLTDINDPEAIASQLSASHANKLTRQTYDDYNRVTRTDFPTTGTAIYTESRYDIAGRRWLEIDADRKATAFVYDDIGRLTHVVTDMDPTTTTLPNQNPSSGAWTSLRLADSTVTHYEYDDFGRLKKQTDGRNNFTTFEYDEMDRRTKRTLPDTTFETWAHDFGTPLVTGFKANGVQHVDFKSQQLVMVHNLLGQLTEKRNASIALVTYDYTASGQRARMVDNLDTSSRETRYVYDEFNRLVIKDCPEGALTYGYGANGQLASISARERYYFPSELPFTLYDSTKNPSGTVFSSGIVNPNGAHIVYDYDGRDRLHHVYDGDNNTVATYSYDASGNLENVSYQNGVSTSYTYNQRNQLRFLKTARSSTTLASFDYDDADPDDGFTWPAGRGLSDAGLRRGVREILPAAGAAYPRHMAYSYDNLNRLTRESLFSPQWAGETGYAQYDGAAGYGDSGYDAVGNRAQRTISSFSGLASASYATYDANDRLGNGLSAGKVTALYDANGNTLRHDLQGDGWDQGADDGYDVENRLTSATRATGNITLVYDGDGNRVQKTLGTEETHYLVDDHNLTGYAQVLEERDEADTLLGTYIYGTDLVQQNRSGTVHFYGYDGLGSVRFLTDGTTGSGTYGQVTDTYTYDAFGIQLPGTGSTLNHYRYAGEQWDDDLKLYYLRARYYKPELGRFWSMDTYEGSQSDPMSLHKYLYVAANPVNYVDPSGKFGVVVEALSAAASIARYALDPNRNNYQASSGLSHQLVNTFDFDTEDDFEFIELHLAFQQLQLMDIKGEVQRGVAALGDSITILWNAVNDTHDLNKAIVLDLILSPLFVSACFAPDTQVVLSVNDDGTYVTKAIQDIVEGDFVLSRDAQNPQAEVRLSPVVKLHHNTSDHLRFVLITDVDGRQESICTTDEHPFWVEGRGWTTAASLLPGDRLAEADDSNDAVVTRTLREEHPEGIKVYNFEVNGDHSYFVTDAFNQADVAAWVHNVCKGARPLNKPDLGVGNFYENSFVKAAIVIKDGVAHVNWAAISGGVKNWSGMAAQMAKVAKEGGAETLRITMKVANPKLREVLTKRYDMFTGEGGYDVIIFPLK